MREDYRPFPIDCLPGDVAEFVREASESIGCDQAYVGMAVLVAIAGATGNRFRLEVKGDDWTVPALLWGAIVGESGTLKSPAIEKAVKPIEDYQSELFLAHRNRLKNGSEHAAPERVLVNDITVERLSTLMQENPRGLLLCRDELAGFFNSLNQYKARGADEENWLSIFDARSIQRDRQVDKEAIYVPRASVSIIGGVQPSVLQRLLDRARFESGMAARFLLVMPPERKRTWNERSIQPETADIYAKTIRAILDARNPDGVPILLRMSPEAKKAWIDWFNKHGERQNRATGNERAMLSKMEGYAARLALVHHVAKFALDGKIDSSIGVESIRAGTLLADWFVEEAFRVYSRLRETDADRETRELLSWIGKRPDGATARELQRAKGKRFPTSEDAEEALIRLKRDGLIRSERKKPGSKGGRESTRYFLNDTTTQPTELTPDDRTSDGKGSDTTTDDSVDSA